MLGDVLHTLFGPQDLRDCHAEILFQNLTLLSSAAAERDRGKRRGPQGRVRLTDGLGADTENLSFPNIAKRIDDRWNEGLKIFQSVTSRGQYHYAHFKAT